VRRVVLATRNAHKVGELKAILDDLISQLDLEIVGVGEFPDVEDVVETGVTFAENAALKAVAVAGATGLPSLADDSGLAVDVLGGSPGVFSARWAGIHGQDRANLDLLLAQLSDVPDIHRSAAFVCPTAGWWFARAVCPARWPESPAATTASAMTRSSWSTVTHAPRPS
jgi:XTP/dITP diphosphohydrolase